MNEIALFAGLILLGYTSRFIAEGVLRNTKLYSLLVKYLVDLVYRILLPVSLAVVFLNRGVLFIDAYITLYFSLFIVLVMLTLRIFHGSNHMHILLTSTFPNSVFLGFPLCYLLFGDIKIASIFGVLTLTANVLVPDLIASKKTSIRLVLNSPPLIGFIIGILGYYLVPRFIGIHVYSLLNWSPRLLSYLATYTMGLRIPIKYLFKFIELKRDIGIIGFYRFIIAPFLAFVISLIAGLHGNEMAEFIVVSMTPPAVMNLVVAEKYNWKPEHVALLIALLTILFLVVVFPAIYITLEILL